METITLSQLIDKHELRHGYTVNRDTLHYGPLARWARGLKRAYVQAVTTSGRTISLGAFITGTGVLPPINDGLVIPWMNASLTVTPETVWPNFA